MEKVILYRFFLFGFGAGRFRLRTASRPAVMPLPKAQCRLKPPQLPAQSSVSPTKYSPGQPLNWKVGSTSVRASPVSYTHLTLPTSDLV